MFLLVTGPPAAGKTTLSTQLATELGLPRLAKDTIKRGMLAVLGADDLDSSRRVGAAAVSALLAVAAENSSAVLDSVWVEHDSVTRLLALPAPVIEVFCVCDLVELRRRYQERSEQRPGRQHDFDLERPASELWNDRSLRPLDGGWPVLRTDTTAGLDVPMVAQAVRRAARSGPTAAG